MSLRKLAVLGCTVAAVSFGSTAMAQDELSCSDIEWESAVTDQYPSIAEACDAVLMKNDKLFSRI